MTKIEIEDYSHIKVTSENFWGGSVELTVQGETVEMWPREARELVKALKKHIKKAEGN